MDFNLPPELSEFLRNLDRFIDQEIRPLQAQDDNERFFDHRREWARTDFDNGGLPRKEWEALLGEAQKLADTAGHWRFSAPKNTSLNWTMPELVNIRVGSLPGTNGADGTMVWPLDAKNSRKSRRISEVVFIRPFYRRGRPARL